MSLDLITDLRVCESLDVVVVFCDLLTKMAIFEPTTKTITAEDLAKLFQRQVFRRHGIPTKIVSDRDPRFMSTYWQQFFRRLGTRLNIPCKILRQISPVAFKVQLPPGARCNDVFHASQLEKWTIDDKYGRVANKPPPLITDPSAEFVVDRLLDVDFNNNLTGLLFKGR